MPFSKIHFWAAIIMVLAPFFTLVLIPVKEYAELEWPIDILDYPNLGGLWCSIMMGSIFKRREKQLCSYLVYIATFVTVSRLTW